MRVLVTGSTGLVGQAIAERLSNEHQVVGLSRGGEVSEDEADHLGVDLASPGAAELIGSSEPCAAIVHAAASLDPQSPESVLTNCIGAFEIVRLAAQWGAEHLVFISGVTVIGTPSQLPIDEDHPVHPPNPYLESKLLGEQLVEEAGRTGVRATILRVTAPVGARMPAERVLPTFVREALAGSPLKVAGRGTRRQDYVHVADVADAVAGAIQAGADGLFNIGCGETVSNLELAQRCHRIIRLRNGAVISDQSIPPANHAL